MANSALRSETKKKSRKNNDERKVIEMLIAFVNGRLHDPEEIEARCRGLRLVQGGTFPPRDAASYQRLRGEIRFILAAAAELKPESNPFVGVDSKTGEQYPFIMGNADSLAIDTLQAFDINLPPEKLNFEKGSRGRYQAHSEYSPTDIAQIFYLGIKILIKSDAITYLRQCGVCGAFLLNIDERRGGGRRFCAGKCERIHTQSETKKRVQKHRRKVKEQKANKSKDRISANIKARMENDRKKRIQRKGNRS